MLDRAISSIFGSIGPLKVTRLGRWMLVKDSSVASVSLIRLAVHYEKEGNYTCNFT